MHKARSRPADCESREPRPQPFVPVRLGSPAFEVPCFFRSTLRAAGEPIEEKELLGVIVEVGMDDGLDALASYKDGTGRYINYTGKMIISEAPDDVLIDITAQLFRDSMSIVQRIGPWDGARKPHPVKGKVRITFLVSDGLYFGEGPINVLFNDAMAAPALSSATALMNYMTNRVLIKG